MEQEDKLYMYVYRSILIDIFNNVYRYNEKLPTLTKLCDIYSVGRNTVRSALLELQKDGYVIIQRGKRAIVTFHLDDGDLYQQYTQKLSEIKHIISSVFETMECLFPTIGNFALKNATDEQINILINQVNHFDIDDIQNESQFVKELFEIYEIGFSFMNNPILDDLVTTLLYSIYIPSYAQNNKKNSHKSIKQIQSVIKIILKTKQSFIVKKSIAELCHSYSQIVDNYIDELCQGIQPKQNKKFVWNIHRGEDYLYMKVASGIVLDINNHIYKKGDLLPSILQIAEQYGVSERTSRRALVALREFHIIQTINGVGSKVIINILKNNTRLLKNIKLKTHIQSYYNASDLLAMINEVIIPKVLKSVSDEEINEVVNKMKDSEDFLLSDFYDFIYNHTNDCLYVIYKELQKYNVWGYFVNFFIEINSQEALIKKQSLLTALEKRDISIIVKLSKEISEMSMQVTLQ